MKENELQQKLSEVFNLLRQISVSGDAVDIMAAARMELRQCYQMAADKPEEKAEAAEAEGGEKK